MSSLLNVSNDSSKPEEFSLKDIEVLADNKEQNWFKRAHIGRYLGIARTTTSTSNYQKKIKDLGLSSRPKGVSLACTPWLVKTTLL